MSNQTVISYFYNRKGSRYSLLKYRKVMDHTGKVFFMQDWNNKGGLTLINKTGTSCTERKVHVDDENLEIVKKYESDFPEYYI